MVEEWVREERDDEQYSYDYGKTGRIEFRNWRERYIHIAVSRLAAYFLLGKDPQKDEGWAKYQKWRCNATADWFILLWRVFRYRGSDNDLGVDESFKIIREAEIWS